MDRFLRRVVVGSGVTFLSLVVIKCMTLINSVIAARLLQPADYGAYSIVVNLESLAVIIAVFGIPVVMTKRISELTQANRDMARSVASALMMILLITSSITAVVYLGLSEFFATELYNESGLTEVIRLSSILVLIASINVGFSSVVQGCQRIRALARVNTAVAVLAQPVTFLSIWSMGLNGAILALILTNLISLCMFAYIAYEALGISFKSSKEAVAERRLFRPMLAFAFPLFLSSVILILAHWIGRTYLATEWSFEAVGDFQIADNLSQMLLIVSTAMSVPLLPMISEQDALAPEAVGRIVKRILSITSFVVVPLCLLALPFLDIVINFLYGSEYETAYAAAALMFGAAAYKVISSVVSNAILGTGRVWHALGLNLVWLSVFIAAMFMFVGDSSSEGLAVAYALSFGGYALLLNAYLSMSYRVPVSRVSGLCLLLAPLLLVYVEYGMGDVLTMRILYGLFSSLAVAILSYRFVLDKDERRQVRAIVGSARRRLLGT